VEIKPVATVSKRSEITADEEEVINDQLSVTSYQLEQNYPNPFSLHERGTFDNPSTMINFSLPAQSQVMVSIYNETGQLVRTLVDNEMTTGQHSVRWNGRNESGRVVAAGMYFYKIVARNANGDVVFTATKRMTILK
jgi:hypothetical protein